MHIDKFYKDSLILTSANLFTGIIGFIFSIILSRELGPQGLGLYGLIMPVYSLVLCLSCDGLITAVSKVTAVYRSKKDSRNLHRSVSTISFFIFLWSLSIALLVLLFSNIIGSRLIDDPRSIPALRIICPAIIFVSLSAILKGYFYGFDKFKTAAYIDIVEKILRVTVLLTVLAVLTAKSIKNTVSAAYFSLMIGEFISFVLLYAFYRRKKSNAVGLTYKPQGRVQLLFNILIISSPLCINGFLSSILSTASTLILPRRLVFAGIPYEQALALIGKFLGMAASITYLPIIIINSVTTVLVPDLSINASKNNFWALESRIKQVFKIACFVGTCTLIINLSVPKALGMLFYNRTDLGGMIAFASLATVLSFVAAPTFGMLNGLGKQNIVLRNSLIISILALILIYIFTGIPKLNIYGYGLVMFFIAIATLVLNIREIKKACDFRFPLTEALIYLFSGILTFILISILNSLIPNSLILVKVISTAVLSFVLVYFLAKLAQD